MARCGSISVINPKIVTGVFYHNFICENGTYNMNLEKHIDLVDSLITSFLGPTLFHMLSWAGFKPVNTEFLAT